jgi:hypothetical protein
MSLIEAIADEGSSSRKFRVSIGRDELNLAEFPLTHLARHVPEGVKVLIFEDKIRDQSNGSVITRRLTITGDELFGLPNAWDEDVIVALIQITKIANNFTERTVSFSRFELIELLGWPDNGQSLRRLDESLNRWLGVTLRYEKAWWDKSAQSWVNEGFHMLDNLALYDKETLKSIRKNPNQNRLPFSSFTWNEVVFRSFQAENLKSLDLELYFQLNHPTSKRAFRFLDKRFYRNRTLEFDLRDFACEHVGLSKSYDTGKLKAKLAPALAELEAAGFLESMPQEQRFIKKGRGDWRITLVRSHARKIADEEPQSFEPHSPIVLKLIERKVSLKSAKRLEAKSPHSLIERQIEAFDYLMEIKDKKVAKSPAGYLVRSIEDEYELPKGFISGEERQRLKDAKIAAERQATDAKRRQREQEAREWAEKEAINAYWKSLDPDAQAKLEEAAKASADPETLALCTGPFRELGRSRCREAYIRTILQGQGKLPIPSSDGR